MTADRLDNAARRRLRAALSSHAPWLSSHAEAGPATVDAGQCDRCGQRPRLVPTCGPVQWRSLCRECTLDVAEDAWCDGHEDVASSVLAWLDDVPDWWGDAVVAWWVSTGEVAPDPHATWSPRLPAPVRAALPGDGAAH